MAPARKRPKRDHHRAKGAKSTAVGRPMMSTLSPAAVETALTMNVKPPVPVTYATTRYRLSRQQSEVNGRLRIRPWPRLASSRVSMPSGGAMNESIPVAGPARNQAGPPERCRVFPTSEHRVAVWPRPACGESVTGAGNHLKSRSADHVAIEHRGAGRRLERASPPAGDHRLVCVRGDRGRRRRSARHEDRHPRGQWRVGTG